MRAGRWLTCSSTGSGPTASRAIWTGDRSLVEGFDPRRTPDEFVRREPGVLDCEVLDRYLASTEAMVADLASAGPERFGSPGSP